jgi:hypothetical protein
MNSSIKVFLPTTTTVSGNPSNPINPSNPSDPTSNETQNISFRAAMQMQMQMQPR